MSDSFSGVRPKPNPYLLLWALTVPIAIGLLMGFVLGGSSENVFRSALRARLALLAVSAICCICSGWSFKRNSDYRIRCSIAPAAWAIVALSFGCGILWCEKGHIIGGSLLEISGYVLIAFYYVASFLLLGMVLLECEERR